MPVKTKRIHFWFFDKEITTRIPISLWDKVKKFNKETGISFTEIYVKSLFDFFNNFADISDKKTAEFLSEIIKKNKLKIERKTQKETDHNRYLVRNTQRKLFNMESASLYTSGKLNMKLANAVIDDAFKIYNLFPKKTKDELKDDVSDLTKFKNETFLQEKVNALKFLGLMGKK